jgi:hypothetical protein
MMKKTKAQIKSVYFCEKYQTFVTVYEEEKPSFIYKKMLELKSRHCARHNSLGHRV